MSCLYVNFVRLFQSDVEELRQVLWLSVVLYKSPDAELSCCLLLSTNTVYFLLEDSAATLGCHSGSRTLGASSAMNSPTVSTCKYGVERYVRGYFEVNSLGLCQC